MKKILLVVGVSSVALSAMAQTSMQATGLFKKNNTVVRGTGVEQPVSYGNRAVIWEDDFSDFSNWTVGNNAGNTDNWVLGTAGPSGSFAIDPIASSSAANGFAMFDSDLLCSGNQSAWVRSSSISTTGIPAVILEFQQFYRKFSDEVFVQVSNDGTNWTDFPVNTSVASNQSTANPSTVSVNISSVAGNQATVFIRFLFLSDASNGGDGCDYAWMVDDVKLVEAPDNDLSLDAVYYGEYSRYPLGQELPIDFSGKITNFGGTAQTNVELSVAVNGTAFGSSTPLASLAVGATDSSVVVGTFNPSGVGTYNLSFTASQDQVDDVPANNTLTRSIQVTDYTFARDNNNYTGSGIWNGSGNGYIYGNLFELSNDAVATSISVVLQGNTDVGAIFKVVLLDDLTDSPSPIAESDFYEVTAADINSGSTTSPIVVKVPFIVPTDIPAGEYIAGVDFGGGTEELVLASNTDIIQPIQTTFIFDYTENPADWFYTTSTPMIRLNVNEPDFSSVNENGKNSIQVYPNPSSDYININFGDVTGDVTLAVYSSDGKQVMSSFANVVSGQNITLDVNGLAAGIYTVRAVSTSGTFTSKVVIK